MIDAALWRNKCAKDITAGYSPGGVRGDTYESGVKLAQQLAEWGVWQRGDVLVDVGCGNGRLAMGLLAAGVTYIGLDVVLPCVEFCRDAFREMEAFRFVHLDVYNARYWPEGAVAPNKVVYPLDDACADVVVANSLFTHTGTLDVARRNLREMRRILKPGGRLYTTWFFGDVSDEQAAKTVYRRRNIEPLLAWVDIVHEGLTARSSQTALLGVKRD